MQVFLPTQALSSIALLDPKRLGNQVYREAKTLISGGWPNHPASKIWSPHRHALACYALLGLEELTKRGRNYPRWYDFFSSIRDSEPDTGLPSIVGNARFHAGHRAALLAKDPAWYSQFGWTEQPEPDTKKAYIWSLS